jgi:hypothetical protein
LVIAYCVLVIACLLSLIVFRLLLMASDCALSVADDRLYLLLIAYWVRL